MIVKIPRAIIPAGTSWSPKGILQINTLSVIWIPMPSMEEFSWQKEVQHGRKKRTVDKIWNHNSSRNLVKRLFKEPISEIIVPIAYHDLEKTRDTPPNLLGGTLRDKSGSNRRYSADTNTSNDTATIYKSKAMWRTWGDSLKSLGNERSTKIEEMDFIGFTAPTRKIRVNNSIVHLLPILAARLLRERTGEEWEGWPTRYRCTSESAKERSGLEDGHNIRCNCVLLGYIPENAEPRLEISISDDPTTTWEGHIEHPREHLQQKMRTQYHYDGDQISIRNVTFERTYHSRTKWSPNTRQTRALLGSHKPHDKREDQKLHMQ